MITMNDPQCNPRQGLKWCNLAQNSQTFPTWPFIFQNIAFAASFWQPMPNLLSKQILLLNKFNETSSCSEIRPWSKLASTLKNKAGQIVCQILSSNMKEQKPKKHSLSSSLPLSSHVSTSFYLSPLPFILDIMCQKMIYSVSNIDIWCVIDWSNVSKLPFLYFSLQGFGLDVVAQIYVGPDLGAVSWLARFPVFYQCKMIYCGFHVKYIFQPLWPFQPLPFWVFSYSFISTRGYAKNIVN